MDDIRNVVARAPITAGDVLIENVAETGVEVVATKDVGIDVGTST
jgi:CxxC motif-containing protein